MKYVDLCRWSPVTQRHYLQLLAGELRTVSAQREAMQVKVPNAIPQLAFLVDSVRCLNAAPQLLDLAAQSAWELRSRLAACLSYAYQGDVRSSHVLAPAPVREAVLAGLRLWLGELARRAIVCDWQLQPTGRDTVVLRMAWTAQDAPEAVIPIRLPQ